MRVLWLLLLVGCIDPVDPRWSLNHDHVVVARATPPTIMAGDTTNLDALVAHAGRAPSIENPLDAAMARTDAGSLRFEAGLCLYTAPDVTPLVHGVPATGMGVDVLMTFARSSDRASLDRVQVKKTVWLGDPAVNPDVPPVTIDGSAAPAADAPLTVALDRDIYVSADAPDAWRVNWLTSAGSLFQDDEHTAYLHVLPADAHDGWFAIVIRDDHGGVAWRVWPISAR